MATKQCPFCAEEINEAAIYCKHCQKDLKNKNFSSTQLTVYVLLPLLALIVGFMIKGNSSQSENSKSTKFQISIDLNQNMVIDGLTPVRGEIYTTVDPNMPTTILYACSTQKLKEIEEWIYPNGEINSLFILGGTIDRVMWKSHPIEILSNSGSLLAISTEVTTVVDETDKCSVKYTFDDVNFDGFPFTVNLSSLNLESKSFNPQAAENGELSIPVNQIIFQTRR